jgi:hypothetical protein
MALLAAQLLSYLVPVLVQLDPRSLIGSNGLIESWLRFYTQPCRGASGQANKETDLEIARLIYLGRLGSPNPPEMNRYSTFARYGQNEDPGPEMAALLWAQFMNEVSSFDEAFVQRVLAARGFLMAQHSAAS